MKYFTFVLLLISCWIVPVEAEEGVPCASLSALVEEAVERDGKTFVIRGELIGEPLTADHGVWLNILEEGNPLAVFCPEPQAGPCLSLIGGSHARRGHRLQLTGVLHRVCLEHGADHDFHATSVRVESEPQETPDNAASGEVYLLVGLLVSIGILSVWPGSTRQP